MVERVVNAWNGWDPLEEVVVGRADGAHFDVTEPGHRPRLRDAALAERIPFPAGPKRPEVIERANAELAGLVAVLEARGITVRRPERHDFSVPIETPDFRVEHQYCSTCPRDVLMTVGNEIIEATMSRRARFFEYRPYRKLIYEYWQRDTDLLWTAAPKPSMADTMYRRGFWGLTDAQRHARMHDFEFCVSQDEVIFDAADCTRVGRDIFVQESMTSNRLGIEWLRRHLRPRGVRVHAVHFPLDYFPSHIDCTFVPLRPGFVLTNPERPLLESERALFVDNGWKLVDAPQPSCTNDEMPLFCQSSKWLAMNVLSISPKTVICEESEIALHDLLDRHDFEVIPLPFRNVYEFGGSFHCVTWDVRRQGGREDYFTDRAPVQ